MVYFAVPEQTFVHHGTEKKKNMSAKWLLDTAAMKDDFFEDALLMGIACPLPAYRFCWNLNLYMGYSFSREPELDILVGQPDGTERYFPVYRYLAPLNGYIHHLYQLKIAGNTLFPEIRRLDYLWLIQRMPVATDGEMLIQHVKKVPEVQLVSVMDPGQLRHPEYLLV